MKFQDLIFEILIGIVPPKKVEKYKSILMSKPELNNLDFSDVEFGYDDNGKLLIKNFKCKKHDWVRNEFTRYSRVLDSHSGCNICGKESKSTSLRKSKEYYIKWASTKFPIYDWSNVTVEDGYYKMNNGITSYDPIFSGIICNLHKDNPNHISTMTPNLRSLYSNLAWSKDPNQKRGIICNLCSDEIYNKVSVERNTYSIDEWNERLSNNELTKNLYIDVNDSNPKTRSEVKRFKKEGNLTERTYIKNIKCKNHEPHFVFGEHWIDVSSIMLGQSTCPICSGGVVSKGEKVVLKTLKELNYEVLPQKTFEGCFGVRNQKVCTKLRFDAHLMIGKQEVCVEYDGQQHFRPIESWGGEESFYYQKQNDKIKNEFCEKNNIKLIRISYKTKPKDIQNELIRLLGLVKKTNDTILYSSNYPLD